MSAVAEQWCRYLRVIAELATELQLPSTQPLLHSCAGLLRELWDSDERNVVTPTHLVHHIRKANKAFRNRDQHDSHELLRYEPLPEPVEPLPESVEPLPESVAMRVQNLKQCCNPCHCCSSSTDTAKACLLITIAAAVCKGNMCRCRVAVSDSGYSAGQCSLQHRSCVVAAERPIALRWLLDALHEETKIAVPDSAAEAAPSAASCSRCESADLLH